MDGVAGRRKMSLNQTKKRITTNSQVFEQESHAVITMATIDKRIRVWIRDNQPVFCMTVRTEDCNDVPIIDFPAASADGHRDDGMLRDSLFCATND